MSAIRARFSRSTTRSGRTAWARSTNNDTAGFVGSGREAAGSGSGSGATGRVCSPSRPRRSRLVATMTSPGQPPRRSATKDWTPPSRCSQLSRTRRACLSDRNATTESTTVASVARGTPSKVARAGATAVGSGTGASSHQKTPSMNRLAVSPAALSARRVFPTPPTPVSVSRRACARALTTASMSAVRPKKLVTSAGGPERGPARPADSIPGRGYLSGALRTRRLPRRGRGEDASRAREPAAGSASAANATGRTVRGRAHGRADPDSRDSAPMPPTWRPDR